MSAYWDLINLGVCIKGQADRLGIEHEGVALEGVVVRLADAAQRSRPRVITTEQELIDLPNTSLIRNDYGDVYERRPEDARWDKGKHFRCLTEATEVGDYDMYAASQMPAFGPFAVLFTPTPEGEAQ